MVALLLYSAQQHEMLMHKWSTYSDLQKKATVREQKCAQVLDDRKFATAVVVTGNTEEGSLTMAAS